jgi:hypothetical protein
MRTIIKSVVAAAVLAAGTIGATAPAQARWHGGGYGYHGGYHHHGGIGTGGAIGLGILGLGVGAAIASSDRGPRYNEGYYAPPPPPPPAYYYGGGYYAPPPPPPAYYYGGGYGW